jgi:hypothetical protein
MSERLAEVESTFSYDEGRCYFYDGDFQFLDAKTEYMDASEVTKRKRLTVAQSRGLTLVLMALESNYQAPLTVEIWDDQPWSGFEGWEHIVEFNISLPSKKLHIESGPTNSEIALPVTEEQFRARLYMKGLQQSLIEFDPHRNKDRYRLQLWPGIGPMEAFEWKRFYDFDRESRWPGHGLEDAPRLDI